MKLTINKVEQVEVEVTFPHYRKNGTIHYFAFISEKELLMVKVHEFTTPEIELNTNFTQSWFIDGEEISHKEFTEAYNKALKELNAKFNTLIENNLKL